MRAWLLLVCGCAGAELEPCAVSSDCDAYPGWEVCSEAGVCSECRVAEDCGGMGWECHLGVDGFGTCLPCVFEVPPWVELPPRDVREGW